MLFHHLTSPYFRSMNKILLLVGLSFLSAACGNRNNEKEQTETADSLLEKIDRWSSEDSLNNPEIKREYSQALFTFIDNYPDHPRHESLLFHAGGHCVKMNRFDKAAGYFAQYAKLYPEKPAHAQALFGAGFIYHNELNELDSAKKYFQLFIDQYPDHLLRESAELELQNLGRDPDDILDSLIDKIGKDSTS